MYMNVHFFCMFGMFLLIFFKLISAFFSLLFFGRFVSILFLYFPFFPFLLSFFHTYIFWLLIYYKVPWTSSLFNSRISNGLYFLCLWIHLHDQICCWASIRKFSSATIFFCSKMYSIQFKSLLIFWFLFTYFYNFKSLSFLFEITKISKCNYFGFSVS